MTEQEAVELISRLRAVADREDSGPMDAEESDAAYEDVPEVTWQELREIVGLLREAAHELDQRGSSTKNCPWCQSGIYAKVSR